MRGTGYGKLTNDLMSMTEMNTKTFIILGKQCFFVLRQQQKTAQAIAFVNEATSKQMIKFIAQ